MTCFKFNFVYLIFNKDGTWEMEHKKWDIGYWIWDMGEYSVCFNIFHLGTLIPLTKILILRQPSLYIIP